MQHGAFVYIPHLEVRLCEDAGQLSGGVRVLHERVQIPEDLLQELHVVLPHWRQPRLLGALLLLLTFTNSEPGFNSVEMTLACSF